MYTVYASMYLYIMCVYGVSVCDGKEDKDPIYTNSMYSLPNYRFIAEVEKSVAVLGRPNF